MNLQRVVANLAQKVQQRYYGKYRALVVDNADPEQLGRLKLQIPSVLGEQVVTGWAMPCVPYGGDMNQGFLFIPEVGAGVWVEFEEGDLEFPIWVGTFWSKPGGDSELPKPNDPDGSEQASVQDPPTRKIIKTKKGHTIQFEDADGEERIIITDGEAENRIVLTQAGLKIINKNNTIMMSNDGIIVEDTNSNKMTQDTNGILIEDKNGNQIIMASGGIQVGSSGANEPLVLGTQLIQNITNLLTLLSTHTHVGNMGGPTSPPVVPIQLPNLNLSLSQKHKVE